MKATGKFVKIGYSTQDVHARIRNAATDPTYLEAPVRVLATMACYNLNPQKFENLIHAFLHQQRLNMALMSTAGKPYHPEEWFAVDMETAVEVCQRIVDGTIGQCRMEKLLFSLKMCRQDLENSPCVAMCISTSVTFGKKVYFFFTGKTLR